MIEERYEEDIMKLMLCHFRCLRPYSDKWIDNKEFCIILCQSLSGCT